MATSMAATTKTMANMNKVMDPQKVAKQMQVINQPAHILIKNL